MRTPQGAIDNWGKGDGGDRRLAATRAVLADRERELLDIKGPCSNKKCRLHYAHSGPCDCEPQSDRESAGPVDTEERQPLVEFSAEIERLREDLEAAQTARLAVERERDELAGRLRSTCVELQKARAEADSLSELVKQVADGRWRVLAELHRVRATLAEAVRQFYEHGHPGYPALRSCWVRVSTVERWRAVLAEPARESGAQTIGRVEPSSVGHAKPAPISGESSGEVPPADAYRAESIEVAEAVRLADERGEPPVRAFPAITDDDRRTIYAEADAARLAAYPAPRAVIVAAMDVAIDATVRLIADRLDAQASQLDKLIDIAAWRDAARFVRGRTDG